MNFQSGEVIKNIKLDKDVSDKIIRLNNDLRKKANGQFKDFEDFLSLPFSNYAPKFTVPSGIKHAVLIGVGGSNLGSKAVYDTLFGYFDVVTPGRLPKLHFIENVDASYIDNLLTTLSKSANLDELAFVIVCKSGRTYETSKNLVHITSDKYKNVVNGKNTYVVSVEGSPVWEWGKQFGAKLFPMPQIVSGRFSVFSAVSLVPLKLAGINTDQFLEGAKQSVNNTEHSQKNVALRYQLYKDGLDTDVYFAFDRRLKRLAEWMCSVTAESLGKGGGGITPITSVGSRDLHSIGQLYLQGKRNKFTTFLSLSNTDSDNKFILEAAKKAYNDAGLPYVHVELATDNLNVLAFELGSFIQSKMIETVLLGGLLDLNPYDQPGVELYKKYLQ